MPKVPSSSSNHSGRQEPQPLKRNQACHQCRRRKLKCDAKRPACSTCIRSHAHAVSHAPPGTQAQLPSAPECTFDEIVEPPTVNEPSKTRYEKLESRIQELEALLLEKETQTSNSTTLANHSTPPFLPGDIDLLLTSNNSFDDFISATITSTTPGSSGSSPRSSSGLEMVWPNYPPGLPNPDLLRHLVEFHGKPHSVAESSEISVGASIPPLHAICALGSLYTAAPPVTSPPHPDYSEVALDEIFSARHRLKEARPDSFAEQQAKYARETADHLESIGDRLFELLQARTILSWFYWSHCQWLEVYMSCAHSLRIAVPLGLNVCPPCRYISIFCLHRKLKSFLSPLHHTFHTAIFHYSPGAHCPGGRDQEKRLLVGILRRKAYMVGSFQKLPMVGLQSLDDEDISQLLPVRGDHFEKGTLVTPPDRQWAQTRNLLLLHPDNQTDSFVLYVKAVMLMSKVKTFNLRFRAKHFFGDSTMMSPHSEQLNPAEPVDPRGSPAFIELDNIAASFRSSFPPHLRQPIAGNVVDQHLYLACTMPYMAIILLHDPHANVRRSGCVSAVKILTAARSVLDLAYAVYSTSFDMTFLDPFCTYCWFIAGRVLVRFLQAAMDANTPDQISTLRAELDFLEAAMLKVGQRVPLAFRYGKMLKALTTQKSVENRQK
ncbi:Eukaryotic translation initiation factor 3 subunit H [Mycena sanguinolenta]|uniref:Eukaryotic translation initiation factor 3 subunit H n=1 Tax=Mycena sanguinolenta TaxID=230812 RepID=A0A8H7CIX9_9AGAR|nr:Eukaryotic translation initiation factor 3 subunit H [Mycena sanguinolenta]